MHLAFSLDFEDALMIKARLGTMVLPQNREVQKAGYVAMRIVFFSSINRNLIVMRIKILIIWSGRLDYCDLDSDANSGVK